MTDRRLALVVAVDSYDHAALHRLAAPAAGADALAGVLGDPTAGPSAWYCCYGGAFERGVVARAAGPVDVGDEFRQPGRGRVVITASTAME
ncbi:hypothetical protein ACIA5C_14535 [Actinoplanes sp. NPDC051343]|uniref:hypothetical protein n=1 Tax=Actinoplanes sp. NPDC051343 TaxID=3363906 RepID=UPI0037AE87D6